MTGADGFSVVTLIFPDPRSFTTTGSSFLELNASMSFRYDLPGDIVTLSSTNADLNNDITGLLYVPELDAGSTCDDVIYDYVPRNATSNIHLPQNAQFAFLAIAPWISQTCTNQWLYAARDDPLRAFIFFSPNVNETAVLPASDTQWSLGDGGKWKKSTKFPVYAIAGQSGSLILQNLARYSGNLTEVPFGQDLANEYPPTAYVRLAAAISMDGGSALPSLWAFLLIVIGILVFIIASTSCLMHFIQKRRRDSLRRRVANGEVDLERLGIKRLTVPKPLLDQMPLYTYPTVDKEEEEEAHDESKEAEQPDISKTAAPPPTNVQQPGSPKAFRIKNLYTQPTCAICLDDFVPGESVVRELPCRHIFHSECVDTFLRENSSLCPLCKKSSLPTGYCPAVVTNAMVRRERMLRRMRERMPTHPDRSSRPVQAWNPTTWRIWSRQVFSAPRRTTLASATPSAAAATQQTNSDDQRRPSQLEMRASPTDTVPLPQPNRTSATSPVPSETGRSRSEWARRRALAMVGRNMTSNASTDELEAENRRRPRWRRVLGKIWPGLV